MISRKKMKNTTFVRLAVAATIIAWVTFIAMVVRMVAEAVTGA